MLSIFKKAPKPTPEQVQQTIAEIHNEFFTAGDKILKEALDILEPNKFLMDKARILERAGFKSSVEVVKAKSLSVTQEQADIIKQYQVCFPNNKFITDEQVKTINEKYGLVCAPIDRYTGFVPMSKLENISKFHFDEYNNRSFLRPKLIKAIKTEYNSDKNILDKEKKINKELIFSVSNDFGKYSYDTYIKLSNGESLCLSEWEDVSIKGLFICAPQKDINMEGLEKYGVMYSTSTKHKYIPDPVVLQPVKHGWLIVEAWGDEASDPIVVNETMN